MGYTQKKSYVLLAIFRRKGGEGLFTKIMNEGNKFQYVNQLSNLSEDEEALICYKKNEHNWLLLTTNRIIAEYDDVKLSLLLSDLREVSPDLKGEAINWIINREGFTRLLLKDFNGKDTIITLETGKPFQGMFQLLHYIASQNITNLSL